jgi:hypothetical protein
MRDEEFDGLQSRTPDAAGRRFDDDSRSPSVATHLHCQSAWGKRRFGIAGRLALVSTALEELLGGSQPHGKSVMDLAEADSGPVSSWLVLAADQQPRHDRRGKLMYDQIADPLRNVPNGCFCRRAINSVSCKKNHVANNANSKE